MAVLPKHTNSMLKYKLENSFLLYRNMATAFINKDGKLLQEIIDGNFEEFSRDNNMGLIRKLLKVFSQANISDLSSTYLTLKYR
jgi:hypothetical protein